MHLVLHGFLDILYLVVLLLRPAIIQIGGNNYVINHINSYSRNQRAPFTPFDLMEKAYLELIKKLGLKKIAPDDILLSPRLLKNKF